MEFKDYLFLISKRKGTMASLVFIFVILAIIFSLIQPFKYGSSSQVLVIQNFSNPDPYLASKSTEYLSNILARVIYSNSFFENVLNSGYYIDKNYFGKTVKGQMEIWSKTVSAKSINDSGIIALNIYHTDRSQVELINRAVVYILQTKHGLYHGGGENVSIKIIDEPITSNYPVKPNLILNFGLALVLAMAFFLIYVYLLPEEKYNIRLIPKFYKRQSKNDFLDQACETDSLDEPLSWPAEATFSSPLPLAVPELANELGEERFFEKDNSFDENLINQGDDNYDDGDDLDMRQEIVKQGSMKNIFGKPYSDDY